MGKASRRKRRSSSHGDRTHPAAAEVPAPNFDGTAVQLCAEALQRGLHVLDDEKRTSPHFFRPA